jgi:hypothetical protein
MKTARRIQRIRAIKLNNTLLETRQLMAPIAAGCIRSIFTGINPKPVWTKLEQISRDCNKYDARYHHHNFYGVIV